MTSTHYKLILLDRDGTINHDEEGYIGDPDKWQAINGSLQAIAELNQMGIKVAVISNQSGLGRGLFNEQQLQAVHNKMAAQLQKLNAHVDKIFYCPHHPNENCHCRKPKPYLLAHAQQHFGCELHEMAMIGDSLCDMIAARNHGCDAYLVLTGHGQKTLNEMDKTSNIYIHDDLYAAVTAIVKK